ncbi:hypothetical protein EYF80_000815 [Liparis tanakae]|uniref:Uncharacterized protein n=1 Tax=Liparis tanakae TaxID=230148 RepID=A0A4Z2JG18_9TELE|nr:hypothetical protein EYF80_000815 [Liparis tanakae]
MRNTIITGKLRMRKSDLRLKPEQTLFGEGKHGEDDQKHGDGTQEEAAPPDRKKRCVMKTIENASLHDTHSFGVDVEAYEDASQQVAGCRPQGAHHNTCTEISGNSPPAPGSFLKRQRSGVDLSVDLCLQQQTSESGMKPQKQLPCQHLHKASLRQRTGFIVPCGLIPSSHRFAFGQQSTCLPL